jgi:hypothetical protein
MAGVRQPGKNCANAYFDIGRDVHVGIVSRICLWSSGAKDRDRIKMTSPTEYCYWSKQ